MSAELWHYIAAGVFFIAFALTTETIVEMIVRAVEKRRKVRKP